MCKRKAQTHRQRKRSVGSKSGTRFGAQGIENLESRIVLTAATPINEFWTELSAVPVAKDRVSYVAADEFAALSLEVSGLKSLSAAAPHETLVDVREGLKIGIPTPDGELEYFAVVETAMMEPELAAEFPEIKTYRGVGIDNPTATVRFDFTEHGFHGMVRDSGRTYFIDPYFHLETEVYASYYRAGISARPEFIEHGVLDPLGLDTAHNHQHGEIVNVDGLDGHFHFYEDGKMEYHNHAHDHGQNDGHPPCMLCGQVHGPGLHDADGVSSIDVKPDVVDIELDAPGPAETSSFFAPRTGTQLRTYRTAVSATVEYTNFHGGTVSAGQSAIVTAMNRVSGIYEDEMTIRMTLVGNNSSIVFAGSDSFSNGNPGALISQNQSVIDSVIGSANYDVGHNFSTGGGGLAGFGVIGISGSKAQGISGLPSPTNDSFWVDYVAHEFGHQFGGSHTFNGDSSSCAGNRSSTSAYEPGSGTTIMAYAGICGNDNTQNFSNDYFHSRSLDQIVSLVNSRSGTGTWTATGNTIPTADAGSNFTIPVSTPFILTGSGADADGDTLTYNWEQRNLGPQQDVNAGDNGRSPIFRSWSPTQDPSRTFPRLSNLLANNTVRGETLPTTQRTLSFRLTVRDNRAGGGGVATDDMSVSVRSAAGPFLVNSPNTNVEWPEQSTQTVTWDVAGTTGNGVNTSNVNILLSTDGGNTFPITLAANTPNDGSETIVVPSGNQTNRARVKVEAVGNIFFDVSNQNFRIVEPADTIDPEATATANDITTENVGAQIISVTYTDDIAIDVSTLGSADIEVIAPDGSSTLGFVISSVPTVDVPSAFVQYQIWPSGGPGSVFTSADNGTHEIRVRDNQVTDTGGNQVTGLIGTFEVNIGSAPIDGDFDDDGDLDCDDVNALSTEIAAGTDSAAFDLTGDGVVDRDDLDDWIFNEKGTIYGDANLDFVVDVSDLNVWSGNKFTTSSNYCDGDFNADGVIDITDLNIWSGNKFQTPDGARIADVGNDTATFRSEVASIDPKSAERTAATERLVALENQWIVDPVVEYASPERDVPQAFFQSFQIPHDDDLRHLVGTSDRLRKLSLPALDAIFGDRD